MADTVSVTRRGVRGESATDVARRVGSFMGLAVDPDATDEEVLDAANIGGLQSLTTTREGFVNRTGTPVAGSSGGGATLAFATPMPTAGRVTLIEAYGGSAGGTCKIKRFTRAGNVFTMADEHSFAVTATTLSSDSPTDFEFDAGDYLAFYGPDNSVAFTLTEADHEGWYLGSGDVTTNFTDSDGLSTAARFEVRFTIEYIVPTEAALKTSQAVAAADGHDHVMREFLDVDGELAGEIGLQNVDDQDPQAFFLRAYSGDRATWFDFTTYQFGGTIKGHGQQGHTLELQLDSDTDSTQKPDFSVRRRDGGTLGDGGSRIQTRNSADTVGFWISLHSDTDAEIALEDHADTPLTITISHPKAAGAIVHKVGGNEIGRVIDGGYQVKGRAAAPTPAADSYIIWQKEAGGADDGDLMVTINSGGTTKTATLVDFSTLP